MHSKLLLCYSSYCSVIYIGGGGVMCAIMQVTSLLEIWKSMMGYSIDVQYMYNAMGALQGMK